MYSNVENMVFAKVGALVGKEKIRLLSILTAFCFILSGCASSDVSRDVSANVDFGVQNAKNLVAGDGDFAESYQNSSQMAKGAILGGTLGALVGGFTTAIGVIPGATTGLILGASYGSYIDSETTLKDQLENRGGTIVVLGDQVLVVIPSTHLFNPWSSSIKQQGYPTLNLVAQYVNGYTKMLVKVSAYTGDSGSAGLDMSLSQQQAESVSRFLLASGIDARVLYASGYGGTHLVVKNSGEWDSDNNRIEITLEKLYV
jgi:outer membrane protein OmpA-like peptidoglycan-associated protein